MRSNRVLPVSYKVCCTPRLSWLANTSRITVRDGATVCRNRALPARTSTRPDASAEQPIPSFPECGVFVPHEAFEGRLRGFQHHKVGDSGLHRSSRPVLVNHGGPP